MPTPAPFDMHVQRVITKIRLPTDEPAETGIVPFKHLAPGVEPVQLIRCPFPKCLRIFFTILYPAVHDWTDQIHRILLKNGIGYKVSYPVSMLSSCFFLIVARH